MWGCSDCMFDIFSNLFNHSVDSGENCSVHDDPFFEKWPFVKEERAGSLVETICDSSPSFFSVLL